MKSSRLVAIALCVCALPAAAWGQTVINGSFEMDPFAYSGTLDLGGSNPLTGWSTNSNGTYPWGLGNTNIFGGGPTPYGNQWVVVGYYGQGGTYIEQTISGFTVGQSYSLDFALASELASTTGALVEVSIAGMSGSLSEVFEAPLIAATYWDTWGSFSKPFVASDSDLTIRFFGLSGPGFDAGIDNVSVSGGVVPEPATLLLLGGGLAGLRLTRKKRSPS